MKSLAQPELRKECKKNSNSLRQGSVGSIGFRSIASAAGSITKKQYI